MSSSDILTTLQCERIIFCSNKEHWAKRAGHLLESLWVCQVHFLSYLMTAAVIKHQERPGLLRELAPLHVEMFYDETHGQCSGRDSCAGARVKTYVSAWNYSAPRCMKGMADLISFAVQLLWVQKQLQKSRPRKKVELWGRRGRGGSVPENITQWNSRRPFVMQLARWGDSHGWILIRFYHIHRSGCSQSDWKC